MQGFWNEKNWRLDNGVVIMPNGWRISLKEIRQWHLDQIEGRADLPGKWAGWRIRQNWLIAPGQSIRGAKIAEPALRASFQWTYESHRSRRQLALF